MGQSTVKKYLYEIIKHLQENGKCLSSLIVFTPLYIIGRINSYIYILYLIFVNFSFQIQ